MIKKAKKETKNKETATSKLDKKTKKSKKDKIGFLKRTVNYIKEIKSELKKVAWPTRKNVFNGTMTVVVMVIIVMAIVVSSDLVFGSLLKLILGVK